MGIAVIHPTTFLSASLKAVGVRVSSNAACGRNQYHPACVCVPMTKWIISILPQNSSCKAKRRWGGEKKGEWLNLYLQVKFALVLPGGRGRGFGGCFKSSPQEQKEGRLARPLEGMCLLPLPPPSSPGLPGPGVSGSVCVFPSAA